MGQFYAANVTGLLQRGEFLMNREQTAGLAGDFLEEVLPVYG